MKKIFAVILILTAFVFGVTAAASFMTADSPQNELETAPVSNVRETPFSSGMYTLRTQDGKIAVFTNAGDSPPVYTDIEVDGLRRQDKELLERGIETANYEEMLMLLEDFSN